MTTVLGVVCLALGFSAGTALGWRARGQQQREEIQHLRRMNRFLTEQDPMDRIGEVAELVG